MIRTAPHAETLGPGRRASGSFRGPFTRWPRGADAVLATVLFLLTALLEEGPGDSLVVRPVTSVLQPALLLLTLAGAALYLRRRRPVAVLWRSSHGSRRWEAATPCWAGS